MREFQAESVCEVYSRMSTGRGAAAAGPFDAGEAWLEGLSSEEAVASDSLWDVRLSISMLWLS